MAYEGLGLNVSAVVKPSNLEGNYPLAIRAPMAAVKWLGRLVFRIILFPKTVIHRVWNVFKRFKSHSEQNEINTHDS